jgi:hypothetical protein
VQENRSVSPNLQTNAYLCSMMARRIVDFTKALLGASATSGRAAPRRLRHFEDDFGCPC